jgi:hypothetical protein
MRTAIPPRIAINALILVGGLLLTGIIVQVGISGLAIANDNPTRALSLWGGSAQAAAHAAEEAVRERKLDRGRDLALRSLNIRVQNSQALRVVATLAQERNEQDVADMALTLAARLGWRDGFAQLWLLNRAMAGKDWTTAARAADALLRIEFARPEARAALQRLMAIPEGRRAIAERLAARPQWGPLFFSGVDFRAPHASQDFGTLLIELNAQGVLPGDKEIGPFFRNLLSRGDYRGALEIWRAINPGVVGNPTLGVIDGDFAYFATGTRPWGPFGWRPNNIDTITLSTPSRSEFSSDPALRVDVVGETGTPPVVTQMLALAPGRYRIAYDVEQTGGLRSTFRWRVSCDQNAAIVINKPAVQYAVSGWSRQELTFEVPSPGCASQHLMLTAGQTNSAASATFDNVQISLVGSPTP